VHRLDRVASGVVLCATTGKALKRLNAQIQDRAVRKVYHAVVEGRPLQDKAVLEHWLVHARHHARIGRAADEGARKARLRYQVLRQHADTCLLEVELETGRYHQIRAQLGAIGCPILGDARYGATQAIDAPAAAGRTIALHHRELSLDHPVGGSPLTIEAAYPDGWPGH
jgi:23S rRNA pseudouridine1911/1915/1917 synthase